MFTSLLTVDSRPLQAPLGKHDTSSDSRSLPNRCRFYNIYFNMEDEFHHMQRMQQALKGLKQQPSCLAKGVKDLKREEEASFEQSSRRDFGEHPMHDNQWGYSNFSPRARSYDCNEGNIFGTRNDVRDGGNFVNMDERFHQRKGDFEGCYASYNYRGYNYGKGSQTWGLHQNLLVTTASEYENRRRKGAQQIKTWTLMKQSLKNRFGVGNHEGQRQGQPKAEFMESQWLKSL
ncbi:hypothetical protein M9H77_04922 [Catharanthus roseus]|uniref:Uncharacterized protein n=1 Tax=Catharanthus roseus TaxID=4058 RepID=A0ACC0CFM9_CATRO|nr:hypothetical protein M9H77_04922 [Catharanthus roseus]